MTKDNTPLVSVVIPTRNRPILLLRAIESVLKQTISPIEIIVVIDGIDPDTISALEPMIRVESRVRLLQMESTVGGAEARNCGVREAKGKWVALLDDDDEWMPDKTRKQLAVAEKANNPYVLVFSRMVACLPDIKYIWPRRLPDANERMSEYLFCRRGLSFGEGFLQTSSFFTSRQMLLEVPFKLGQQRFQDTDWLLRACAHPEAQFEVLPEPLVLYYIDEQRETVSRKSDWAYLHEWALQNRGLLSPRAFSFFLATQCIPRAAKQNESLKVFVRLLWECFSYGSPSGNCVLLFFIFWFIPEKLRRHLRDAMERKKPGASCEIVSTKDRTRC